MKAYTCSCNEEDCKLCNIYDMGLGTARTEDVIMKMV